MPGASLRGVLEGFYGRPWTWDERLAVARWCGDRGMTHYVWAPKDDPLHRAAWRAPWTPDHIDGFARIVAVGDLELGLALSPGLSMTYDAAADREALWDKVAPVVALGATLVVLALDDIPNRRGLGAEHAEVTTWLHARLAGSARLVLVPTEYVGARPTPYLSALAVGVPDDVAIAWTGEAVVNDEVTAGEAVARAEALGGRAPVLWDNHPVNDAVLGDRLVLGPLGGRDPDLLGSCDGYLANALVQPLVGRLPLSATAAWLMGQDPVAAWVRDAEALGVRVLAEACVGEVPAALVRDLRDAWPGARWADAAAPLARWLSSASDVAVPPGLEDEVGPWAAQVAVEARLGLRALRLLAATRPTVQIEATGAGIAAPPSDDAVLAGAFSLMGRWPAVRRAPVSVLGVRFGFRPSVGQRSDGVWQLRHDALQEGDNALDELVRLALAVAADTSPPGPLEVSTTGGPVEVDDDGRFIVAPGTTVVVRSGVTCSEVTAPCEPPIADRRL